MPVLIRELGDPTREFLAPAYDGLGALSLVRRPPAGRLKRPGNDAALDASRLEEAKTASDADLLDAIVQGQDPSNSWSRLYPQLVTIAKGRGLDPTAVGPPAPPGDKPPGQTSPPPGPGYWEDGEERRARAAQLRERLRAVADATLQSVYQAALTGQGYENLTGNDLRLALPLIQEEIARRGQDKMRPPGGGGGGGGPPDADAPWYKKLKWYHWLLIAAGAGGVGWGVKRALS